MQEVLLAIKTLLTTENSDLWSIVLLSLRVSALATILAAAVGLPLGAFLAVFRFPGRRFGIVLFNALMGLPPVVAGLLIYLLLSRAGPFGEYGLLFTPAAMVIAQSVLITPIIVALSRQVLEDGWFEYRETLLSLGASLARSARTLLWEFRYPLITVVLAGFGRAVAEVGAVLIVGGNIAGVTRTMTTTIALETSKGDLALALALGAVLVSISIFVNALAQWLKHWAIKRDGSGPS